MDSGNRWIRSGTRSISKISGIPEMPAGRSGMNDFFRGKRVFVTGHTGFKGSWLCMWLNKMGAEVTGLALEPPTDPSLFEISGLKKFINHNIGNILDDKNLKRLMSGSKSEIVFHMAAQPLVL